MARNFVRMIGIARRFCGFLFAAMLLAGTVAQAQVNDPALIAAAQREGSGVLYTGGTPAAADRIVKTFEEIYGIHLDTVRANSGPLSARFQAEWETGNHHADVLISSDQLFLRDGAAKGWFENITRFPEARAWPKEGLSETALGASVVPYVLLWNTNAVPAGLKTWTDLLEPKLAGRVMISDPRVVTEANGFFILMRRVYGDDFLRKLGKQLGGVSPSANPGAQQIAAGANDAYVPGSYQTYMDLKAKGAPLDIAIVSPTAGSSFNATLVSKAPHAHVAELLIRFLMTPRGQTANNAGGFSHLANVPETTRLPKIEIISGDDIARERPELIQLLGLNN